MKQFFGKRNELKEKTEKLERELQEIKEQLDDTKKKLEFCVDRQYYFNSFYNIELGKLQYIPEGGILICGNYGDPNTGDEWMLETIINYIRKYSDKPITVMLINNRLFDPSKYLKYNINYIHCPQTVYDYDIIEKKFDILIFGGGAIIEDSAYYEVYDYGINICRTLVDLPLRFVEDRKKVFCIGLSTGKKLSNLEYIKKLQIVINESADFSVRDPYSLEMLKEVGIETKRIKMVSDIVYANDQLFETLKLENEKKEKNDDVFRIGLVYITGEENRHFFECLLEAIDKKYKSEKRKYLITIIPFYDCWHIDYKFYSSYINGNIKVLDYDFNIKNIMNIFLEQDLMICARYHAILLSLCLKVPCVSLYYDMHPHYKNKISYLLEQFKRSINDAIKLSSEQITNEELMEKEIFIKEGNNVNNIILKARNELNFICSKIN